MLLLLLLLLLVFSTLLILHSNGRRRSLSTFPPSPRTLPIIGNLHQISPLLHVSLHKLSQKLGPIMLLHMGHLPTVVVSSPELAEEVLKAQDQAFADRPTIKVAQPITYGQRNVSFGRYGEYWRCMKKLYVVQLLSSRMVQGFRRMREEEVGSLVGRIRELCCRSGGAGGGGTIVDLTEVLYQFSNGTILRATTSGRSDEGSATMFREMLDDSATLIRGFQIYDVFPSLWWIGKLTGMDRKVKEVFKKWDAFLSKVVHEHEHDVGARSGGGGDFVDVLLSLKKDPAIMDIALSNDDIKSMIMDMNAAGTDTGHSVLEWTMSELINNPVAMAKVKRELADVVAGKPTVTEDDLPRLRYLKSVLKEVLRLHPPAPLLLPHESMQETRLHGYTVPSRTRVVVNVWALGRDPRWWDSPEQFSPERFMGEEGDGVRGDYRGQDFRFLPFGSGRRGCPGMNFAMSIVELAMANLLYHFEWAAPLGGKELDMSEAPGITIKRAVPLQVVAKPCQIS